MREPSSHSEESRVRQRSRPAVWARPDRPRGRGRGNRGPQPSLTVEVIVDAAIAIADAEGVDAVSMRRIAGQLGAGTMSLYRYVATKDDLLDLMADQISGDCGPLDPPEPGADWRDGLRADAVRTRQVLLAHPWAGPLLAGRPMLGRQSLRRQEYLLRLVDGRGLGIDEMAAAVGVVTGYVRGVLLRELAEREVARRTGLGEDEWRAYVGPYVRELMADGDFPLIERYMVEGEDHPDPDAAFLSGLESVLDGVAARLARAA